MLTISVRATYVFFGKAPWDEPRQAMNWWRSMADGDGGGSQPGFTKSDGKIHHFFHGKIHYF
jgi:hypothetical protein